MLIRQRPGESSAGLGVIAPGQPFLRMFNQYRGVFHKCRDVVKGIDTGKVTGMDQAHKQIADEGAMLGFIKQRIFTMKYGFFKRPFTEVVVQRRIGHAEKEGQRFPMLEHICYSFSQP